MENYSLSDIAAASGGNEFGGNGIWLLVILFFLIGMGGSGFGNNKYSDSPLNTYATAASQQEILFGQRFGELGQKVNQIGDGICSSTYALNNAIQSEGRNLQMQIADCCCGNKEATAQVRYDMSNFAAGIQTAIHAEGEQTRAMMQQDKIAALQGQVNQLQLQSALCGVVRYPNATTYSAGVNPYYSGCGCGSSF